jgi:hypothetical protein
LRQTFPALTANFANAMLFKRALKIMHIYQANRCFCLGSVFNPRANRTTLECNEVARSALALSEEMKENEDV